LHLLQAKAARLVHRPAVLAEEESGFHSHVAGGHAGNFSTALSAAGAHVGALPSNDTAEAQAGELPASGKNGKKPDDAHKATKVTVWSFGGPKVPGVEPDPQYIVPSKATLGKLVRGSLFYMSSAILFAILYVTCDLRVEAPEEGLPSRPEGMIHLGSDHFHFGLLDFDGACGRDCEICFCAFFCLGIRWADTLGQRKLRFGVSFWLFLGFHVLAHGLSVLTLGISSFAYFVVAVYFRQRIRNAFGLKRGLATVFQDVLTWMCCFPCAVAQEAREVMYFPVRAAH